VIYVTRIRNNSYRENRETLIDDNELNKALDQASALKDKYFRLRALAVLSLLRLSGKRRTEISWIPLQNFKVEKNLLTVMFTLEKKKRKHKKCPDCSAANSSTSLFCKSCGLDISKIPLIFTSKQAKAVKAFPLSDSLTKNILEYLSYLRSLGTVPKFWLPSGRCVFGNYMIARATNLPGYHSLGFSYTFFAEGFRSFPLFFCFLGVCDP